MPKKVDPDREHALSRGKGGAKQPLNDRPCLRTDQLLLRVWEPDWHTWDKNIAVWAVDGEDQYLVADMLIYSTDSPDWPEQHRQYKLWKRRSIESKTAGLSVEESRLARAKFRQEQWDNHSWLMDAKRSAYWAMVEKLKAEAEARGELKGWRQPRLHSSTPGFDTHSYVVDAPSVTQPDFFISEGLDSTPASEMDPSLCEGSSPICNREWGMIRVASTGNVPCVVMVNIPRESADGKRISLVAKPITPQAEVFCWIMARTGSRPKAWASAYRIGQKNGVYSIKSLDNSPYLKWRKNMHFRLRTFFLRWAHQEGLVDLMKDPDHPDNYGSMMSEFYDADGPDKIKRMRKELGRNDPLLKLATA